MVGEEQVVADVVHEVARVADRVRRSAAALSTCAAVAALRGATARGLRRRPRESRAAIAWDLRLAHL